MQREGHYKMANDLTPCHRTGNSVLSVALVFGTEQRREWLNLALNSMFCYLYFIADFRDDRLNHF
jgi:hypothetical protein